MALKCRCICGCKLLVSAGSAGKRIKCPKCERKLRVPVDVVEQRREQLESRKHKSKQAHPVTKRSKIEKPLSSLVDLPDPEPPPIQSKSTEPIAAKSEVDLARKPPPLPIRDNEAEPAHRESIERQPTHVRETTREPTSDPYHESDPPDTADVELPIRGYEPDRDKIATVRWLATAILITGLVGTIPAIIDVVEHLLSQTSDGLSRWACALLFVGLLQSAYAFYLIQLPDWSSVWVVTTFTLALAAGYAAMFGLTMLANDHSHLIQVLDLADRLRGGKATAWCLIMLSLMSLTSYFSGRIGAQWRSAFVG
jgi:hypothetical protein